MFCHILVNWSYQTVRVNVKMQVQLEKAPRKKLLWWFKAECRDSCEKFDIVCHGCL